MTARASIVAALLALAACAAPASAPPPPRPGPAEITILFTTDEHGWVLPHTSHGRVAGGAADMLGQWIATERHCPGPPSPPCRDPRTLALSGGDNFTGPAISTYFDGAPMAEAMARMGYAASAFGNHELDFGRGHFLENRKRSGVTYLAANLRAPDALPEMKLAPFAVFERKGVKIGVVGLSPDTTLKAAMARRFEGITFEDEEPALDRGVRGAWAAGVDAVVAILHECPDKLAPILERHPEWRLSFVGAGHCHKVISTHAGAVPVIAPGWRLDHYARVRMRVDPSRPPGERVLGVEPSVVSMSRPEGQAPAAPPDAVLAQRAEAWRARVDAALGEEIGWTERGLDRDSPEMGRWIAGAIRAEVGADVAIVNQSGLRQSLPRGPITKASIWSIMPFDNRVMLVTLDGAALLRDLVNKEAVLSGALRTASGFALDGGRPLDPSAVYRAATLDFLFFGGDSFAFEKHARGSEERADWREIVIAWTKKQRTAKDRPLEACLPR